MQDARCVRRKQFALIISRALCLYAFDPYGEQQILASRQRLAPGHRTAGGENHFPLQDPMRREKMQSSLETILGRTLAVKDYRFVLAVWFCGIGRVYQGS